MKSRNSPAGLEIPLRGAVAWKLTEDVDFVRYVLRDHRPDGRGSDPLDERSAIAGVLADHMLDCGKLECVEEDDLAWPRDRMVVEKLSGAHDVAGAERLDAMRLGDYASDVVRPKVDDVVEKLFDAINRNKLQATVFLPAEPGTASADGSIVWPNDVAREFGPLLRALTRPGRKRGDGVILADHERLVEMRQLIVTQQAKSVRDAARKVAPKEPHVAHESTIARLSRKYRLWERKGFPANFGLN